MAAKAARAQCPAPAVAFLVSVKISAKKAWTKTWFKEEMMPNGGNHKFCEWSDNMSANRHRTLKMQDWLESKLSGKNQSRPHLGFSSRSQQFLELPATYIFSLLALSKHFRV